MPATPKAETEASAPVPPVDSKKESMPEDHAEAGEVPEDEKAKQVTLDSLVPASSLIPANKQGSDSDDAEGSDNDAVMAHKKALATTITICGKAHDMYNRTAGEILTSAPELIAYLATMEYSGPKMNEHAAVKALHHDALERIHNKAKAA